MYQFVPYVDTLSVMTSLFEWFSYALLGLLVLVLLVEWFGDYQ